MNDTSTASNPAFICPVCGGSLFREQRSLRCGQGHSFDIARQGYVSLVMGSHPMGDTADMVRARTAFLNSGIYTPIADLLVDAIRSYSPAGAVPMAEHHGDRHRILADLGGGTGWYSAHILDKIPTMEGVLIDASSQAAKIAARVHPRLSVATADLWKSIPLADESIDIALVVFAPRNPDEIRRILTPGGVCLVVTPQPNHLEELRTAYSMLTIEPEKESRLTSQFSDFDSGETSFLEYRRLFSPEDISNVIAMGPSAFHQTRIPIPLPDQPAEVTISVALHRFIREP